MECRPSLTPSHSTNFPALAEPFLGHGNTSVMMSPKFGALRSAVRCWRSGEYGVFRGKGRVAVVQVVKRAFALQVASRSQARLRRSHRRWCGEQRGGVPIHQADVYSVNTGHDDAQRSCGADLLCMRTLRADAVAEMQECNSL
jgi:hypothetical protein